MHDTTPQPTPATGLSAEQLQAWLDQLDHDGALVTIPHDVIGQWTAAVRRLIRERDKFRLLYLECCTDVIGETQP